MQHKQRIFAMAVGRPGALPVPIDRRAQALTAPAVLDKWGEDAAGVRALQSGETTITMFDVIGEDWWTGGGVTAKGVAAQLRAIGDRPVEVQINSPGGDMFEGIAIYNVLREHPQPVTIKVMGMAASAASVIAMAGDTIEIGAASFMMIHNCWVLAAGNRNDFAEIAAWLEPFDRAMVELYAVRTGQDPALIEGWMNAETYMSGSLAIERGFADALLSSDQLTVNSDARASDRAVNDLRAMELALVSAGATRSEARARINKIKGTPGAAREGTPGAAATDWAESAASLLAQIKG